MFLSSIVNLKCPFNGSSRLVADPKKYTTEVFEPFKDRLRKDWTKGFQALMKYDQFSVRGFMMSHGITPLYVATHLAGCCITQTSSTGTITIPFNGLRHSMSRFGSLLHMLLLTCTSVKWKWTV